ncbi:pikE [Symbiodinium natans]|uniref:PikE protein n=1 Tax=Symbiodinium natans TaxID=878477 RepID=A0A812U9A0_9DINO|nr:pikE [Symbiodinium natans]
MSENGSRLSAGLFFKAFILTASRAANWVAVYLQLKSAWDNDAEDGQRLEIVFLLSATGILVSTLCCYLSLRTEKTRRSRCPAFVVALVQVGALLELSPIPLCPSWRKKPARVPIALEMAQRADVSSFISSFEMPTSSLASEPPDATALPPGEDSPEDLDKLRARVLRKFCVAQVPESFFSVVLTLDILIAHAFKLPSRLYSPVEAEARVFVLVTGGLATFTLALGFADIIISMWIKTDFVQDHANLVLLFYLVEICSWWPFLAQMVRFDHIATMVRYLCSEVVVMILLVVVGFYAIPGSAKLRGSVVSIILHFIGQVALAATLSPFLAGANFLFFDSSLTFRVLNRLYYPVRYVHVAMYLDRLRVEGRVKIQDIVLHPLNCFALVNLLVQIILVYIVVPQVRRWSQKQKAEEFQQKTGGLSLSEVTLAARSTMAEEKPGPSNKVRAQSGLRASIFHDLPDDRGEDNFIEVLNAVGDTFEALLLASQADSPRVRCAVLRVAIQPLSEAGPSKLLQLLPLILPQLLLALRWKTVDDFEDCPLSCFILEKALALSDPALVSMVYWQLLGLATDKSDKASPMYREVRVRLLHALMQSDFNGRQYDAVFCEKALATIADQRRLCYQMRALCRTVQAAAGGNVGRNSALRQQLALLHQRKVRREADQAATQEGGQGLRNWRPSASLEIPDSPSDIPNEPEGRRDSRSSQRGVEDDESLDRSRTRSESLEEDRPRKTRVLFAPDVSEHDDTPVSSPSSFPRERPASNVSICRMPSQEARLESEEPNPAYRCPCFACCFRQSKKPREDIIREEWRCDPSLQQFGNQDLTLLDVGGVQLPVDPTQSLGALQNRRCFVANSAVAPVVLAYEAIEADEGEHSSTSHRLYAMKKGDDLRQDALVLQIFRLMETAWAEHGLREVSLMPYNVLALSPKEGFAAFVPKAKNISRILEEFDGDITEFIKKHCSGSTSSAYDRLCGSTAGYCVATYLLGVGDRHLDNIMMTEEGHFFHIDFGFVLGDDPKPGAPSVRVPREVLEVLRISGRYDRFRELLREAFTLIRRTARLWTALLSLASSAGGNGVTVLRDDAERAIHTVRERLHLELDDASAAAEITAEVEHNAAAMLPVIYDKLHQAGLFWH